MKYRQSPVLNVVKADHRSIPSLSYQGDGVSVFDEENSLYKWDGLSYRLPSTSTDVVKNNLSKLRSDIAMYLMSRAAPFVKPKPERVVPYTGRLFTFYVDPSAPTDGTGTFSSPFNSLNFWATTDKLPGTSILFKEGTTLTLGAALILDFQGTAENPIVFGVYSAATGNRIYNGTSRASINASAAVSALLLRGAQYICIDGLDIHGSNNLNFGGVQIELSSSYIQVLNCRIRNHVGHGVYLRGGIGNVVQGNYIHDNGRIGVHEYLLSSVNDTIISHNKFRNHYNPAVWVWDGTTDVQTSPFKYYGVVSCNTANDCGIAGGAFQILTDGGRFTVSYNTAINSLFGVGVIGSQNFTNTASDFTGTSIEMNITRFCEFGISLGNAYGRTYIQGNRLLDTGALNGIDPVSVNKFARSIELYGDTQALGVRDCIIRYNFIDGAYLWEGIAGTFAEGTEGLGIGIDNNSANCDVYVNYVGYTQGQSVQVNVSRDIRVFSNLLVEPWVLPPSSPHVIDRSLKSAIFVASSPNTEIFNNTILFLSGYDNQKFGISRPVIFPSHNSKYYNNLVYGATDAGIVKGSEEFEYHNKLIGSPRVTVNTFYTTVQAGPSSEVVEDSNLRKSAAVWFPTKEGSLDSTGMSPEQEFQSFSGESLSINTPIGCIHASFVDSLLPVTSPPSPPV